MPDAVGTIKPAVNKGTDVFWNWIVPLTCGAIGYITGDPIDIAGKIKAFDKGGKIGVALQDYVGNGYSFIAGFVYITIGAGVWKMMSGAFGRCIGMFVIGMGLKNIMDGF